MDSLLDVLDNQHLSTRSHELAADSVCSVMPQSQTLSHFEPPNITEHILHASVVTRCFREGDKSDPFWMAKFAMSSWLKTPSIP